jgi:hypothetical protein
VLSLITTERVVESANGMSIEGVGRGELLRVAAAAAAPVSSVLLGILKRLSFLHVLRVICDHTCRNFVYIIMKFEFIEMPLIRNSTRKLLIDIYCALFLVNFHETT